MATICGNLMQRTRCTYFRDTDWACNNRVPASGFSAIDGVNRNHAVLGASEFCVAVHPSDMSTALAMLDAEIVVARHTGERRIAFADFHREPGATPEIVTTLAPGELILGVILPLTPFFRNSAYVKIRDRASYAFALASAAVALDVQGGTIRAARVALGGVATKLWRCVEAQAVLVGRPATRDTYHAAADAALANAKPLSGNAHDPVREARARTRARDHRRQCVTTIADRPQTGIGAPVDRIDGSAKVQGQAMYTADTPVRSAAYAALVRSSIAAGRIASIDLNAAQAVTGVLRIYTHENRPPMQLPPSNIAKGIVVGEELTSLSSDVFYQRQYVAIVVAETLEAARAGADLVSVTYEKTVPKLSIQAERPKAVQPEQIFGTSLQAQRGDFAAAYAAAEVRIDATYVTRKKTIIRWRPMRQRRGGMAIASRCGTPRSGCRGA